MPSVSIIIPAYNEESRIGVALSAAADFFGASGAGFELLVVDDGSTDGTVAAVEAWRREREAAGRPAVLRRLSIAHAGKGAAVRAGMLAAAGDYLLMADADCSTPFAEWGALEAALRAGAQVAVGSRQVPGSTITRSQSWPRRWLGRMFGSLVRSALPVGVIDSQCGFKGFTAAAGRELFSGIRSRGFSFDVEVLLRARSLGYRVAEIPVHWENHPDSRVRVWHDWPLVVWELLLIAWRNRAGGGAS